MTDPDAVRWLPVARPLLPTARELLPYLRRIDAARYYTNRGPLSSSLEEKLAAHSGVAADRVVLSSSATAGLTATLLALGLPAGSVCALPAWTFIATAQAVTAAGLVPWLVDVESSSQALLPRHVLAEVSLAPGPVRAVVVVEPFGHPANISSWVDFREQTGIAVVRDSAASFDSVKGCTVPTVVSLHATKVLGVGEGGFVVWDDERIQSVSERLNFGFAGTSRAAVVPGINGKLSEYAAAVGLAALVQWDQARSDFAEVASAYAKGFAGSPVKLQEGYGVDWVAATTVVQLPVGVRPKVEAALQRSAVGSLRWWGEGLQGHILGRALAAAPTPVSRDLADRSLGLPCWRGLGRSDIERVVGEVLAAVSGAGVRAPSAESEGA